MEKFKSKVLALAKIKANQQNPRVISESKLKKLINSLLVFPKMMSLRPITLDDKNCVLGGNMRQTALGRIAQMTYEEISSHLEGLGDYNDLPEQKKKEVLAFWDKFLDRPVAEVQYASDMTEEEKKQFIIKDNVNYGDWDYDELESWDEVKLEDWGVDMMMPDFGEAGTNFPADDGNTDGTLRETEKLSEVKFVDVYYQPKEIPEITLKDCINTELFEKKMSVIESSALPDEMKDVMKLLAYRFLKIDFEAVANYYAFNATEEEKRIIERLRCVLVDGSLEGFVEDRMLRVNEFFLGGREIKRTKENG